MPLDINLIISFQKKCNWRYIFFLFEQREEQCRVEALGPCLKVGNSPKGGHGDDSVPKGSRDAGEVGLRCALFSVEHNSSKNDDSHSEGEEKEAQFRGTALEGIAQDP